MFTNFNYALEEMGIKQHMSRNKDMLSLSIAVLDGIHSNKVDVIHFDDYIYIKDFIYELETPLRTTLENRNVTVYEVDNFVVMGAYQCAFDLQFEVINKIDVKYWEHYLIKQSFEVKFGASQRQTNPLCKVHPGTFLHIQTQSMNREEIKSFDDCLQCFYLLSGLLLYL